MSNTKEHYKAISKDELDYIEFIHFCGDYIDDFYYSKVYKWDYLNDLYREGLLDFEE